MTLSIRPMLLHCLWLTPLQGYIFDPDDYVSKLGFKRRPAALLKSNSIKSIEFGTVVARRLKQRMGYNTALSHDMQWI